MVVCGSFCVREQKLHVMIWCVVLHNERECGQNDADCFPEDCRVSLLRGDAWRFRDSALSLTLLPFSKCPLTVHCLD